MEKIVFIGFGGHAKSIADSIKQSGKYRIIGYTDISESLSEFPYLGKDDELENIFLSGVCKAVLGIGYLGKTDQRNRLVNIAKDIGFEFPPIIDDTASLAQNIKIGNGVFVGKNAIVNSEARIGDYSVINSGAIIEHETSIGTFSHIAVGAVLCGAVSVGNNSFIGANSTVIQGITVGNNSIIGAGSVVITDIPSNNMAVGIPAVVKEKYE